MSHQRVGVRAQELRRLSLLSGLRLISGTTRGPIAVHARSRSGACWTLAPTGETEPCGCTRVNPTPAERAVVLLRWYEQDNRTEATP